MPISGVGGVSSASYFSNMLLRGARGPEVSALQQQLAAAGFDPGPIDGDFGPMTEAAVRAFQESHGCDVDGVVGPQTRGALGGAAPASAPAPAAPISGPRPTLQQGSRGPAVEELQRALAGSGFDPGAVDGDFGPMTRGAVVRFQAANGLSVDGVVGPQTWGALGGGSFSPGEPVAPRPAADGDFRNRIIDVARAEIGTQEATNNNDGDVSKYPGFFGRAPESYCANFVSWVLSHAGEQVDYFNTETMKHAWSVEGKWKGRNDPQPGDVVWFDWEGDGVTDHVGIVKSVNPNGTITTIEGNTGGPNGQEGVWEKTRTWDTINGFGTP